MLLYAFTMFLSACLLFTVQPMFARLVLPLLGGTPNVWNTCMVFFQAALLVGYGYAHFASSRLKTGRHAVLQIVLLAAAFLVLPFSVASAGAPDPNANPIPWLMMILLTTVGPPFAIASTTAPVLQAWFSRSRHKAARDPYFLYAASNLGSVTGLLGYIAVIEPNFTLVQQSRLWTVGYTLLVALIAFCAVWALRNAESVESRSTGDAPAAEPVSALRRLRWVALAFVPSSLMLGVTTHITTDIAAVPLLWLAPLTLYLITFMMAFATKWRIPHKWIVWVTPVAVAWLLTTFARRELTLSQIIVTHNLAFFLTAAVLHGELAKDRPSTSRLTEFYFLVSLGGVLGGAFNTFAAPFLFTTTLEYQIGIVLACLLMPAWPAIPRLKASQWGRFNPWDIVLPVFVGSLAVGAGVLLRNHEIPPRASQTTITIVVLVVFGLLCAQRPLRFGLAVAALLLAFTYGWRTPLKVMYQVRSFYGILRITHNHVDQRLELKHGTTLHGAQSLLPIYRRSPITYYHPTGPIGQLFITLGPTGRFDNVAVVGLGTGTLAAYAEPGQSFTFYELDPYVIEVANNPGSFTFLGDARNRGAKIDIVTGDARLKLVTAPDARYDLLILDAFSSDSIPMHLMTREAFQLYLKKLAPGGIISCHISNRYLDLKSVVAKLAEDSGLVCRIQQDSLPVTNNRRWDKVGSVWCIVARKDEDFGELKFDERWELHIPRAGDRVWTDDYSNILNTLNW
ncbi:MAG: fused MFS/spermidine synthase [Armatimonadetes bacterium]|nr:fused MFS/spermidine synthase [Armatimonadota bacterium]